MHPMLRKQARGLNATGKIRRSKFNLERFAPLISGQIMLLVAMEALKRRVSTSVGKTAVTHPFFTSTPMGKSEIFA